MPSGEKDRRLLNAPVLPFEYPWSEDEVIWPCGECLPWHVEMFHDPVTEELWVREWHADGCPIWVDIEAERTKE